MKTRKLYRPVGQTELNLIKGSDWTEFPPRLEWQPIFYPVLNQKYAEQIAKEWNTPDEFSGYVGYVTEFEISEDYFKTFEVQNVGGVDHNELWVKSEDLTTFNQEIQGKIRLVSAFYGSKFNGVKEELPCGLKD